MHGCTSSSLLFHRLVIQATSPFLAVHANAAYTRLTGIESHAVIGKPISALLELPEALSNAASSAMAPLLEEHNQQLIETRDCGNAREQFMEGSAGNNTGGHVTAAAAAAAEIARATAVQGELYEICLERLVISCGFGHYHLVNCAARPDHIGRNVTVVHTQGTSMATPPPQKNLISGAHNRCNAFIDKGSNGESNSSSILSNENQFYSICCKMGISPVVASATAAADTAVVTDKNHDSHNCQQHASWGRADASTTMLMKRRKYHHHSVEHAPRSHRHRPMRRHVTHYVLQLEVVEDKRKYSSRASFASNTTNTTAEARILGLTKDELRRRRAQFCHDPETAPAPIAAQVQNILAQPLQPNNEQRVRQGNDDDTVESTSSSPEIPVATCG